jgi:hypothetical protein
MPYPPSAPDFSEPDEPMLPLANPEAARRARRQATVVASLAAVVPTVLAAQGMATLAMDVLGFPLIVAIALAGFLELALVSSALLARASALAGRPGGADAAAVWAVSIVSGTLAATHEFVGVAPGGARIWEFDPPSLLAAGVRVAAPLVAAWLWERVLTAARREHAERTLVELRRDRRLLSVARAALAVRRIEGDATAPQDRWQASRVRRARRRLDRAHVAVLRTVQPGAADLPTWLAAVGVVDVLPAATIVGGLEARAAVASGQEVAQQAKGLLGAAPSQPVDEEARRELGSAPHPDAPEASVPAAGAPTAGHDDGRSLVTATEPARPVGEHSTGLAERAYAGGLTSWAERAKDLSRGLDLGLGRDDAQAAPAIPEPGVPADDAASKVTTVLDLATQGLSQRAIAIKLGISRSTVARVVARNDPSETPSDARMLQRASYGTDRRED